MGRIAGFDYGRARIGISVSDEMRLIASSLTTLEVPKKSDLLFLQIAQLIAPYGAFDLFVIGLPLLLNGKPGEMAEEAKKFGEALSSHFSVPCLFWDERLSSSQADKFMKEASFNRKKRAGKVDAVAAVLILQNYLESLRFKRSP